MLFCRAVTFICTQQPFKEVFYLNEAINCVRWTQLKHHNVPPTAPTVEATSEAFFPL